MCMSKLPLVANHIIGIRNPSTHHAERRQHPQSSDSMLCVNSPIRRACADIMAGGKTTKYVAENKLLWLLHLLSTYIINSRLYACSTEPSLWWVCRPQLPSLKFHCIRVRWIQYDAGCLALVHSTYTKAFTCLSSPMNYNYVQLVRHLNWPLYCPPPVIHDYYHVYIIHLQPTY